MNYYLIADSHWGHDRCYKEWGRPKGYEDLMLKHLRSMVKPEDVLIHLGDLFFGTEASWMEKLLSIKPFKIWLIMGNHDKKSYTWYLTHGFDMVCETISLDIYGKRILLSHVPIQDFGQYDLNVHGHFHDIDESHHEPWLVAIKNKKHFLLAMEYTKYQPLSLRRIVELHEVCLKRGSSSCNI